MPLKVLIVDDSKLARMALAKLLNGLQPDWKRLEAANADEAIAAVSKEQPDLIFLDFNMPGKDGLTLAAELRATHPKAPIAIITANLQQEIVARARDLGASFIPKPLTEKGLLDYLDSISGQLSGGK